MGLGQHAQKEGATEGEEEARDDDEAMEDGERESGEGKCKHLLGAHAAVQRILSHPDVLYDVVQAQERRKRQVRMGGSEGARD
eukprot:3033905-Rhodomonas_salina.3